MKSTKSTSPRRRGRPSRATASSKALAAVDLAELDPKDVLIQIAGDASAPAHARVAAARALLASERHGSRDDGKADAVTEAAIRMLAGSRR